MSRGLLARIPVGKLTHDYAATNVTTSAWVLVSTTIPAAASAVEIFDSSGRIMKMSIDNGVTELKFYITPGGPDTLLPVEWKKGSSLYLKAQDASATVGNLIMNFYA